MKMTRMPYPSRLMMKVGHSLILILSEDGNRDPYKELINAELEEGESGVVAADDEEEDEDEEK